MSTTAQTPEDDLLAPVTRREWREALTAIADLQAAVKALQGESESLREDLNGGGVHSLAYQVERLDQKVRDLENY